MHISILIYTIITSLIYSMNVYVLIYKTINSKLFIYIN